MSETTEKAGWGWRLTWLALVLSIGGVAAALIAAVGSGSGTWEFRMGFNILRYAYYAAIAGGILAIIAYVISRKTGARTGRLNLIAFLAALLFVGYLSNQIATARSVPAIHDATTDLADVPQFKTLPVRADNLEKVPDEGRPELAKLDPENRWKAVHREHYGDLKSLHLPLSVPAALARAEGLVGSRRWQFARADAKAGEVEATATSRFFRFKDDVLIRVRPDPAHAGGSVVDMRSISRVGGSDVGVNAKRIRAFLADMKPA